MAVVSLCIVSAWVGGVIGVGVMALVTAGRRDCPHHDDEYFYEGDTDPGWTDERALRLVR